MTWQFWSVLPVWLLALVATLLVALASPRDERLVWLPLGFAAAVTVTFVIQLAIQRKDGLVLRAMASIGGAMAIFALGTALLTLA